MVLNKIYESTQYAVRTPCDKLIVTGTRQSGVTQSLIDMANDKGKCGTRVLIIDPHHDMRKHIKSLITSDNVSTGIVGVLRSKHENVEEVYINDANFTDVNLELLSGQLFAYGVKRIVIATSGSNHKKWRNKVSKLMESGFTSIFINGPDRSDRKSDYESMGHMAYEVECKMNINNHGAK